MTKGRPGGNPDISDFSSLKKHAWPEPCSVGKTLRLPPAMNAAIKAHLPDWQEICRRAIASELPDDVAESLGWPFPSEPSA